MGASSTASVHVGAPFWAPLVCGVAHGNSNHDGKKHAERGAKSRELSIKDFTHSGELYVPLSREEDVTLSPAEPARSLCDPSVETLGNTSC